MGTLERRISLVNARKSGWVKKVLVTGVLFGVYNGCATPEEECCDCLVEGECITISKDTCEDYLEQDKTPPALSSCVKKNGCYDSCYEAGANYGSTAK